MSRAQVRLVETPSQSFDGLEILTVREFAARLKVSLRSAYRIAAELPPGCVLYVRHSRRILWGKAIEALASRP